MHKINTACMRQRAATEAFPLLCFSQNEIYKVNNKERCSWRRLNLNCPFQNSWKPHKLRRKEGVQMRGREVAWQRQVFSVWDNELW